MSHSGNRAWSRLGFSLLSCLSALMLTAASLPAQTTGSISGTVVDAATLQPMNGAQVSIENLNRGSLTDSRGRFLIPAVPAGTHTLRVSNIGYRTTTSQIAVASEQVAEANFRLEVSAVALDEVVVTGTAGAVERRKVGAVMASVDVGRVQEVMPVATMGQALEARIAGVRSVGAVGGVGASRDLRIRGTSSFLLGNRPVVYIDGLRVDNSAGEWAGPTVNGGTCCSFSGGAGEDRLSDLSPEDIDRIEVLKGAAAATLYGSEASNGVIQIFTKRGRNNSAPTFSFSSSLGFNRHRPNFATTLYPNFTGLDGTRALDANQTLIENGLIQTFDLTVQGGGQDVTYFISGGFGKEEGSIKPNDQTKGNLRVNLKWLASDRWSFDLNSSFGRNSILALQSGNNWTALLGNAVLGNPLKATEARPYGEPWTSIEDIRAIQAFSNANRWTGGFTANFQPIRNSTQRFTIGLDNLDEQKERLLPFGSEYVYLGSVGERNIGYRSNRTATADYLGTLYFGITPTIESDLSWGMQGYWSTEEFSMAIGRGFAGPGVTTVGGAANTFGDEAFRESVTLGFFGQNRFSIGDKLFTTIGARMDGNSAFGVNYGFQTYPKADVAYVLTDEPFIPRAISNLRVRAAVGTSGLSPGAYDQFQTFNPTAVLGDVPGVTPSNPGNPDLEPEKTTEIEGGFDMGLFDDRVGVEVTAYRSVTRDALLLITLPPSQGFSQAQWRNTGEILNTGWEVSINTSPIVTPSVRWNTQLVLDGNQNEILDLGPTAVDGRLGNHRVGKPVNSQWGQVITGYDPAKNRHTRSDTSMYIGGPLPTFNGSLANTLSFGPVRLYGLVSTERGAWFNNGDRPYRIRQGAGDEFLSTLTADGKRTTRTDSLVNFHTLVSDFQKRDNIRLRELSLSYTLPDQLLGAGSLGLGRTTLTASGQNLMWWDDCQCSDPNMQYAPAGNAGNNFSGFLAMPQPRRFLFSLRTSF